MKKIVSFVTASVLVLSMTGCGSSPAPSSVSSSEASSSSSSAAPSSSSQEATLRPAQKLLLDSYTEMLDRHNKAVDLFNADENLKAMDSVVDTGNAVTEAIDSITPMMDNIANFTDEDIKVVRQFIDDCTKYLDELENLIANYANSSSVTIQVKLQNKTGVDIAELYMSPTDDESWGNNLLAEPLKNGETGLSWMTITADCLVWDLQATDKSGGELNFFGFDFSDIDVEKGAELVLKKDAKGEYVAELASAAKTSAPPASSSSSSKPPVSSSSSKPSSSSSSSKTAKDITDAELIREPQTLIYEIGAAFRASEIKFRCYYSDGTSGVIPYDQLNITANGNPIEDGYKFKQAGTKKVVIEYKDWEVDYNIEVVSNLSDKTVSNCELLSEAKTLTYKVGDGFKANEIVIRCNYTDGTHEDFDHSNIEFYVNSTQLYNGYKFKEAGSKKVVMKFMDYSGSFTIKVTK